MTLNYQDEQALAQKNRELARTMLNTLGQEVHYDYMADDIVIEFPYASSLNAPVQHKGKPAVVAYLREMFAQFGGLKMHNMAFYSVAGQPEIVFVEYEGDNPLPNGGSYKQIYINKMQFKDGKMVAMREFWDPKRIIDAFNG